MLHREGHCQTGSHTPGWNGVITGDTGGTDFRFWIFGLEVESTAASREFGEGGLCFKGGRSAMVRLGLGYVV